MAKTVVGRYLIIPAWLAKLLQLHAYVTQLQALDAIMAKERKQSYFIAQIVHEITTWNS